MPDSNNIAQLLADEAQAAEAVRDEDVTFVRNRTRTKDPSQVYSLRLPVDRLEELRRIALRDGIAPSALMRRWVLDRLDHEAERTSRIEEKKDELGREDLVVFAGEEYRDHVATLIATSIKAFAEHLLQDMPEVGRRAAADERSNTEGEGS